MTGREQTLQQIAREQIERHLGTRLKGDYGENPYVELRVWEIAVIAQAVAADAGRPVPASSPLGVLTIDIVAGLRTLHIESPYTHEGTLGTLQRAIYKALDESEPESIRRERPAVVAAEGVPCWAAANQGSGWMQRAEQAEAALADLRAQIARLAMYVQHKEDCRWLATEHYEYFPRESCSCGLAALRPAGEDEPGR